MIDRSHFSSIAHDVHVTRYALLQCCYIQKQKQKKLNNLKIGLREYTSHAENH